MFYRERISKMTITCPKCKTRLTLPDEKLKPEGTRFRCSKCGTSLFYKGKGKKAPQDNTTEQMPSSPSPSIQEPQPPPSSAVSVPERQRMDKESPPSTDRTDSGDIQPTDAAAEIRKIVEKKEKPRKIEAAHETSTQYSAPVTEGRQKAAPRKAVLAGASTGILVLALAAIFFFYSQDKTTQDQVHAPGTDKGPATSPVPAQGKGPVPPVDSPGRVPSEPLQGGTMAEQPSSPMTEEKAIEIVKRSEALLKRTSVDSIVTRWAEENAAKFKIIGWQAKKMDEQKYLVRFTAMDGDTPKGFYFELDVQSGTVKNLAQNPELRKK
jgi:predicted Zn finger-like uncharacterized protein